MGVIHNVNTSSSFSISELFFIIFQSETRCVVILIKHHVKGQLKIKTNMLLFQENPILRARKPLSRRKDLTKFVGCHLLLIL